MEFFIKLRFSTVNDRKHSMSSSSYFGLIKYVNAMSRFSMHASVNDNTE